MGAACFKENSGHRANHCDCPQCRKCERQFLADLRSLHQKYIQIVLYVRQTQLFADRNEKLLKAVHKYFDNNFRVDEEDKDVVSVDVVRKLHPQEYWHQQVDEEWMIQACLRQQKFSDETKVQRVSFDHAYPEYLQFLQLCRYNIKVKKISVPSKCQDIIWHSHMTDAQNYRKDSEGYLGKLLNHMDDIPEEELKKYSKENNKVKNI